MTLEKQAMFRTIRKNHSEKALALLSPISTLRYMQFELFDLADASYKVFQAKLLPNITPANIIGVRLPVLRKFAKSISESKRALFMRKLPHTYYDENMLHAIFISEIKNYDDCIDALEIFLPFVDNWAVCDALSPHIFRSHPELLLDKIKLWSQSKHNYTCRFGIKMLMTYFLDKNFIPEYLEIPALVHSSDYYVRMMQAWFFATALAKQWDATIPYIQNKKLNSWVHNKSIQKARESYRIDREEKKYLEQFKIG